MASLDTVLIVGCGNMGGAMLAGWLAAGRPADCFTVVDPVLPTAPPGVRLLREIPKGRFDAVLLGVKPQTLDQAAPALAGIIGESTVLLSILAGVEIASLRQRLPAARVVVRIMPNLAAAIGKSPLGLVADGAAVADYRAIEALLTPLGTPEWLAAEAQLNAVTALAGSGPAFVYRFITALAEGGAALGLDPEQSRRLAVAMVEGAASLAASSPDSPEELARKVTSPGGTTAAGLAVLDSEDALRRLIAATLRAAADRGAELAAAART